MQTSNSKEAWTLKDAKAHLTQILHLAEIEGPQYIFADQLDSQDLQERKAFVVVPADVWQKSAPEKQLPEKHLGKWLVENTPRGTNLEIPSRGSGEREIPFINEVGE
ncbi:MAG: hypothetical protein OXI16_09985 [Chloroflexota bacterium]|nr:hypothetical protein [Chloroflexota bacterium]